MQPGEAVFLAILILVRQGHVPVLVALLNCPHINVNLQVESHGGTALHGKPIGLITSTNIFLAAGYNKKAEAVALLLASGADEKIKNTSGISGYQEARGGESADVYVILQSGVCGDAVPLVNHG